MSNSNDIISIANEIATQKENIRLAIVAQGVTCNPSTPLNQYPGKIANINAVTTVPNAIWSDNTITSATTSYTVPAGVGIVGGRIFDDNRSVLESVDFNGAIGVTENTCYDCTSLTNVTGINLKYIGENAFDNCYNLTSFEHDTVEYIADKAFQHCYNVTSGLETVDCPNVQYVGVEAFNENRLLHEVSLPACKEIGNGAFRYAGNQIWTTDNIHITYDLTNVEKIGYEGIYNNVSLTTISLPKVKDIGVRCFRDSTSLTTASLPVCETIKDQGFNSCPALTTITCPNIKYIGSDAFSGTTSNVLANINGTNECNLSECEHISSYAFNSNRNFNSLTLADGCYIGEGAFYAGSTTLDFSLTNAYIKPVYVGPRAFCRRYMPYGIDFSLCTYIGWNAFDQDPTVTWETGVRKDYPQGLDFSSMQTFDVSAYDTQWDANNNKVFSNLGSSTSSRVKVWMPKTATTNGDRGWVFAYSNLDLYTDAADSSELGTYSRLSKDCNIEFHYGATHEDFLNA